MERMYRAKVCKALQNLVDYHEGLIFNDDAGPGLDTSFGYDQSVSASPDLDEVGIIFKYCPFCGEKINSDWVNGQFVWWEGSR